MLSLIDHGCKMEGAESHCHSAAGCVPHVLVGWLWTIFFLNEGSHPEHTFISGNCFFFYITVCWRMCFLLFLFCWFHCLLTDFEFCIFRFISRFWSGTFTESTAMLRWENLEGSLSLQNIPMDKIYFSCLKNSVRVEDQVLLYCFPD